MSENYSTSDNHNCLSTTAQNDIKGGRGTSIGNSGVTVYQNIGKNGKITYSCANCKGGCLSPCSTNVITAG